MRKDQKPKKKGFGKKEMATVFENDRKKCTAKPINLQELKALINVMNSLAFRTKSL